MRPPSGSLAPRIFISYCHIDAVPARRIESDLTILGVEIVRDERELAYTDNIESYMQLIRTTDYALVLVSDAFLRSNGCLFEVTEFFKERDYERRILPVILHDYVDNGVQKTGARLTPEGIADYVKHWQQREARIRAAIGDVDPANMQQLARELAMTRSIANTVSEFVFLIRRMKYIVFDDLVKRHYSDLLDRLGMPGMSLAAVRKAHSLYAQAIGQVSLKNRLALLDRALSEHPDFPEALNKRGQVHDELGEWDQALEDYARAITIRPERAAYRISRSYALIRLKRLDEALRDIDYAISLDPHYKEAFNNRADVHRRLGHLDEAERDARAALNMDPEFDLAFATLAEISAARGDYDSFFSYLQQAVERGYPLQKYKFDDIYEQHNSDPRFVALVAYANLHNQRFI
jgi:tetratricopeptide (TPR) repeat protein